MKRMVMMGLFAAVGLSALAGEMPKIGVTLALKSGYGSEMYISNAFFKKRPIVEEMAKAGLDLCWCEGWGKDQSKSKDEGERQNAVSSLKQFNAIWLTTDHESQCPHPAQEVAAALKRYVEEGGGLVISHSTGRYAEAPVDAFWTEVYRAFGLELLHEIVADRTTAIEEDKYYSVFFTDNFADHPVMKGVAGLWFVQPTGASTWGAAATRPSSDWTVLVATGPGGRSYPRDRITNKIDYTREASYRSGNVPLVVCRTLGKGRVVFEAIHKDNSGWMYNIDRWPNFIENSVRNGKRADGLKLLENALRWAAEPSLGDASFTKDYKPVEPDKPPYFRQPDFGQRWLEKPSFSKLEPRDLKPGATGLIGLHSSHSDGGSSVAEYVAEAKKLGLSFLVFTDPLAASSKEKLEKLRADCAANSSADFYCCPGVEFVDLSDMEWIVFADKVSWPRDKMLRDGRWYEIFDGKVMRQPTFYRCQNLYRGALLNNKRIREIGNFDVNLMWSNHVVPMAYDVDRVLFDNLPEILEAGPNVRRTSTISYTRVRRASDLARAVKASVTCLSSVDAAKKLCNAEGSAANVIACREGDFVKLGTDVEIRDFRLARIPGTDTYQCALRVVSPNGLNEIRVEDGSTRTLARFLPGGKNEFVTTFTVENDAQAYPQVFATDAKGYRAVSVAQWIYTYHAGLHRCGDNANLLACNPGITMYPNRDMALTPPEKQLRPEARHYQLSEAYFWEAFERARSREPSVRLTASNTLRMEGTDFPSEEKNMMPVSRTSFPLVQPNVVTVVDQAQGDWLVEPTRTEKNGTCTYCSMPPKVGENEWWRLRHRTYQLCDRVDVWWSAVYQENAPDYRGGYTVVEGEIEFLKDGAIASAFTLLEAKALNPKGKVARWTNGGAFGPGSYYAAVPADDNWFEVVGLKGCEAVRLDEQEVPDGVRMRLLVGQGGQKVRKGEILRYRVAIGRFNEKPHGDQYVKWFAGMMDGSRFMHDAVKGRVTDVNGFLDLAADDHEAAVTVGPTWFIQRYPVRVRGLVDNGSAFCTDGEKIVKPLAFMDGVAFAEVPLEERKTWRFMNRFLANDPSLRFSYVPAMPGHEKATVQILNPTDREITTKVRCLTTGKAFSMTVPAGDFVTREL